MIEYKGYQFEDYHSGIMRVSQYEKIIDLLEQRKPMRICEMGSGISTLIFEKYCQKYGARMYSIEHQMAYMRKYTVMFPVYQFATYNIQDRKYKNVNRYVGFSNWLTLQEPFDFVLCDGPYGCGFRQGYDYGRIQVIAFPLLNKLSQSSILIMHDSNRGPQSKTVTELEDIFNQKDYAFNKEVDDEYDQMTIFYLTKNSIEI